jgi:hypothetical protein
MAFCRRVEGNGVLQRPSDPVGEDNSVDTVPLDAGNGTEWTELNTIRGD